MPWGKIAAAIVIGILNWIQRNEQAKKAFLYEMERKGDANQQRAMAFLLAARDLPGGGADLPVRDGASRIEPPGAPPGPGG